MRDRKQFAFHLTILGILVLVIYGQSLSYPWLEIEDADYYLRNPLFGDAPLAQRLFTCWTLAPENNWIPGTWTLGITLSEIFGLKAGAFRFASLMVHLINGILIYQIARHFWPKPENTTACFFGVALFLCHPIQVESVVWISSMKGLLSTAGALFSMLCVLKGRWSWSYLSFALALLCKQDVFTLPLILSLFWLLSEKPFSLIRLIPLGLLSLAAAFAAMLVNQGNEHPMTPETIFGLLERSYYALGHYTFKLIVPINLQPEYRLGFGMNLASAITAAFVIILTLWLIRRAQKKGISTSFWFLAALIAILPFLGLLKSPLGFTSDRLLYFPTIFLALAGVTLCAKLSTNHQQRALVPFALIFLWTILAFFQVKAWKNDRSLCQHILKRDHHHYLARMNLALADAREGHFTNAKSNLLLAKDSHPERARTWVELTKVTATMGELGQARKYCAEGLTLHPMDQMLIKLANDLSTVRNENASN